MSAILTAHVPKDKRPTNPICCHECGAVQFQRAPDLAKVYRFLLKHGPSTTSEIAKGTKLSISNTSQKLRHLYRNLGIVKLVSTVNLPDGGKSNSYDVVKRQKGAVEE
jgi:hypothetical protein